MNFLNIWAIVLLILKIMVIAFTGNYIFFLFILINLLCRSSPYSQTYAIVFSNVQESVGTYNSWSRAYTSHQEVYLELFEAVWSGNVKKVKQLTIDQEVGKQAHICSHSNYTYRTPLNLAIEKNNSEMVELVLDVAFKQFTPMKFKAKKTEEKNAPLINNYDLSVMMRDMRVRNFLASTYFVFHKIYIY
jgi:hypothetical protein